MTRFPIVFLALIATAAALLGQFRPTGEAGIDFSGNWAPAPHEESVANPAIADYAGVPINDNARAMGLAWDPSRVTLPEHQCQVHVAPYILGGPLSLRIWEQRDEQSQRVVAIHLYSSTYEQHRIVWMDGRPHPPEGAAHTWMGFSTGKWDGNNLTVYTTHIKMGELRRNGLMETDQATLIEHFMLHGDNNLMVHISEVSDPLTLTEPFVRSQVFRRVTQAGQGWLYPCESVVEIANRPRGLVPHYLPGANPFIFEFADKYKIPHEAAMGGAETMYPDYLLKMKNMSAANKK